MIMRMDVIAANGVPFRVVLVPKGERSPLLDVAYENDEQVEFYDLRHQALGPRGGARFGPDGQFTGGRYYLSTLLDHPSSRGLSVHNGVPDWTIDGHTWDLIDSWLRQVSAALASA